MLEVTRPRWWQWQRYWSPRRIGPVLLAAATKWVGKTTASAFTTVMDPFGFPLLQPHATVGKNGGGMHGGRRVLLGMNEHLRGVEMAYMGQFQVQHLSATFTSSSLTRAGQSAAAQRLQTVTDEYAQTLEADSPSPVLLLDGHVCAISTGISKGVGIDDVMFTFRQPYAWESNPAAEAFLFPRWMWLAIGGEMAGGAISIFANASSLEGIRGHDERGPPSSSTSVSSPPLASAAAAEDNTGTFGEPFVQLASWGHSEFHPLMRVTSNGLLLEGEEDGRGMGERGSAKTLRTREGDLQIAPNANLHLFSGVSESGEVRMGTRGRNGTISLTSGVLHWASTSTAENCSTPADADHQGGTAPPAKGKKAGGASFRVDGQLFEGKGAAAVRLLADESVYLAVTGRADSDETVRGQTRSSGEHSDGEEGMLFTGDSRSWNASAWRVNIRASDRVLVTGMNGAEVTSGQGDLRLEGNAGRTSLVLGTNVMEGTAATLLLRSAMNGTSPQAAFVPIDDAMVADNGGYLNLTERSAKLGGPGDASAEVFHNEVHVSIGNSSLLRISTNKISLQTTAARVHSSTPTATPPTSTTVTDTQEIEAGLSLSDQGVVAVNASESVQIGTPGASLWLLRRRKNDGKEKSGSRADGGGGSHDGVPVQKVGQTGDSDDDSGLIAADADAVEIRARAASGTVTMIAGGRTEVGEGRESGVAGSGDVYKEAAELEAAGGRLQVTGGGVTMKGNSTSMEASQRIVLRVRRDGPIHGTAAKRPTRPVVEEAHESMVDLSVEGIQMASASGPISLNSTTEVTLEAPRVAIIHERPETSFGTRGDCGIAGGDSGYDTCAHDSDYDGSGLWSDGSNMTARVSQRLLLRAGIPKRKCTEEAANPSAITGNGSNGCSGSSHIAIEENFISIRAGGAEGQTKQSSSPRATAFRSVPSSRAAAIAAPSACVSSTGEALSERGLSVEVVGPTSVQSTEEINLSGENVLMSSANQTRLHSPGGFLLEGSPPEDPTSPRSAAKPSESPIPRGQRGHILLTPGAGAGVGIGPGLSPRDLLAPKGSVSSLLYVTNSTRSWDERLVPTQDSHLAVESTANSAVAVLSPRGSTSALRFGCKGSPYSGGLAARHHYDGPAGDTLLLELASSPGRIMGDASGRWGIGAVPEGGLAATLHVFSSPELVHPLRATPLMTEEAAWVPPGASLLVESEGFGGVIQILGSGAPRLQEQQPKPEQQRQQGSTANAIVLTTRHTRDGKVGKSLPHTKHSHWIISQRGDTTASRRPTWQDASESSSWIGGLTLSYVSGGGARGWQSALPTGPSSSKAAPRKDEDTVRPAVTIDRKGCSGFGTGSTGARMTVGGAMLAEQVIVFADEGMVRDVAEIGAQGRQQAMDTIRKVDIVTFGWTAEASETYGFRPDASRIGVIAQQAEEQSASLVWKDPSTGRKAVSLYRLLMTLTAALQHLDFDVRKKGRSWNNRLEELKEAGTAAAEKTSGLSGRVERLEGMAETGVESLLEFGRSLGTLEGRLAEHGGQADVAATVLAIAQERNISEKREIEERWYERGKREEELEKEVVEIKARLVALEEQRRLELQEQKARQKAQDAQIQALSLRIGTSLASQSDCESTSMLEVEKMRKSRDELDDRVVSTLARLQAQSQNDEAIFLGEVQRLEDKLRAELQGEEEVAFKMERSRRTSEKHSTQEKDVNVNSGRSSPEAGTVSEIETRHRLEVYKGDVREQAMATVRRYRDHLDAFKATNEVKT